jgi:hypothetical protein
MPAKITSLLLQERKLYNWLKEFPSESLGRLKHVNDAASSAHHVILSLTYAIYDPYIRDLNRMIINLLLCRMRAQRAGDIGREQLINETMTALHTAIDWVTGKLVYLEVHVERENHQVCNRIAGRLNKSSI